MNSQQQFQTVGTSALKSCELEERTILIKFPVSDQRADERPSCEEVSPVLSAIAVAACSLVFYLIAFL